MAHKDKSQEVIAHSFACRAGLRSQIRTLFAQQYREFLARSEPPAVRQSAGMLYQIGATEEFRYATLIILSFSGNEFIPAFGMKSALAQTSIRDLAQGRPPGKKAVEKSRPATTDLWFKSVSRT